MSSKDKYINALKEKKLPIVILDHKWHQLFNRVEKSSDIIDLENKLNQLLKKQGKLNTETKDLQKIKKKLMDEIVTLMEKSDSVSESKIDENKRLIQECNDKLSDYQDDILELPREIKKINFDLMVETMDACYNILRSNEEEIDVISDWISNMRIELKKNVVRKQEMEIVNQDIYKFMHDTFGADVIEIFDMKYNIEDHTIHK